MPDNFLTIMVYILLAEGILVIILLVNVIFLRAFNQYKEKKKSRERRLIAQSILSEMKGESNEINIPFSTSLILLELETFNQRFSGDMWESVKWRISEKYLLNQAKKDVKAKKWTQRVFSSRCFSLTPRVEDQESILLLIDDPIFLVQSHAVQAAIQLGMKEGIIKILTHMSRDFGYARYYYRDALLSAKSFLIFQWIEEIAASTEDEAIHLGCLDVLNGKMIPLSHPFLLADIHSTNQQIRLAALKVFARNPQKNSLEILLNHVHDSDESIRKEAFGGLVQFRSHKTLKILEEGLKDPVWEVRAEAAAALKNMGLLGSQILEAHDSDAARYILQLDW